MAIKRRKLGGGVVRYEVAITSGYTTVTQPDGSTKKVRREHSKTFRTREEARRYWTEQQRAVDTGSYVEPCQIPLGQWMDKWLAGPIRLKIRARTLRDYKVGVNTAIKRHRIADVPLSRLTTGSLEQYYADLAITGTTGKRGLSPASVRGVHALIHSALKKAVKDRLLLANPAAGAELPGRKADQNPREVEEDGPRFHALSRVEVRRLLEESAKPPAPREGKRKNGRVWRYSSGGDRNRWHALWHLLVNGGLRPGEALGLTWKDVDWERRRVRIVKALVAPLARGESWRLEPPKCKSSNRVIELPPETLEALQWHRVQQEAEKITAGKAYQDHGFIFAGGKGDPLDLRNVKKRHLFPLLAAAKLPRIRVYDLRHTHCTLLLGAGVPVHVVSQRMGHASAKMTLDVYANYLPDQHEEAMARYQVYLG